MGIAAIVMVLGTMALLQRNGLAGREELLAAASKVRARIAQLDPAL